MKTNVESINKVQYRINVELTSEDTQPAFDTAYRKLQGKAQIKGFRKGKAPLHLLKKFYKESVAADVADILIKNHLFGAIENEKINPISQPVLETGELPEEGKDFAFTALVDIMPEVTVEGYNDLEISYQTVEVTKDTVNTEVENLRRRLAKAKDIEDEKVEAKTGHLVQVSQTAFLGDKPIERLNADDAVVELGQKQIHEKLEEAVLGMKVGETRKVDIEVPKDSGDEELSGKTIQLNVELKGLKELILPEVNDDFAKDLGTESVSDLTSKIEESQKKQAEQLKREQLENQVLDKLSEKINFDVPPSIVDRVIDSLIHERYEKDKNQIQAALSNQQERDSVKELAKKKAKNSIILHEIIRKEKIELQDVDVDKFIKDKNIDEETAKSLKGNLSPEARENLLYIKAMDILISGSKVSEIKPEEK